MGQTELCGQPSGIDQPGLEAVLKSKVAAGYDGGGHGNGGGHSGGGGHRGGCGGIGGAGGSGGGGGGALPHAKATSAMATPALPAVYSKRNELEKSCALAERHT
eukprot:199836-Prymnesium_polylepis.2